MINSRNNNFNKDLISIGMPAYNGQKYIDKAINSLLKQSYKNFELIISDDASTDNTESICHDLAKKDKRIKYIRQKKNIGFRKNFNFVLEKASGKYFVWTGNDDYWDRDYLKKLYQLFQDYPATVLAVSKFNNVYNDKPYNYLHQQKIENGLNRLAYLIHYLKTRNLSYFYGMHKTANLKRVGGYHADSRPFFHSSDFLTIFKVLLHGHLSYIDEVLFFKRDTGHYTNQFTIVRSLQFNRQIIKKILRFLSFPLFYCYDLYFSTWFTLVSDLHIREKIILQGYLLLHFIKYNLEYISKIGYGMINFLIGFTDKLFLPHAKS